MTPKEWNGIAVHSHQSQHAIDWDDDMLKTNVSGYWKRRTVEAIHIRWREATMNLDSGLQLPTTSKDARQKW